MVSLVLVAESVKNFDSLLGSRLTDHNGLKTSFKSRVLLDMAAVFVDRGRADHLKLAPCKRGLENVRGIDSAFRAACTDYRMDLIDKEDDLRVLSHLTHHVLHSLLKLAAVLCARDHRGNVKRDDLLRAEVVRHVAFDYTLCKTFDHRRLTDTGFTDQTRIVLCAAGQDLNDPLRLFVASDDRVDLSGSRHLAEISAVCVKRRSLGFSGFLALSRIRCVLVFGAAEVSRDIRTDIVKADALSDDDLSGKAFGLVGDGEKQMLRSDEGVTRI